MEWTMMFERGAYHWRLVDARGRVVTRSADFAAKDAMAADATAARKSLAALLGGPFMGLSGIVHAHGLNEAANALIVDRTSR
jgi:hypothetical protein